MAGRAEYLSGEEIGKAVLFENISSDIPIEKHMAWQLGLIGGNYDFNDDPDGGRERIWFYSNRRVNQNQLYVVGGAGSGKTHYIKRFLKETDLPYEYVFLNKETLKWERCRKNRGKKFIMQDKDEEPLSNRLKNIDKMFIIDDLNYAIQIGKFNEISEGGSYNTKEAADEVIKIYDDMHQKSIEENGFLFVLSTENISDLAEYIDGAKRIEFLRKFFWAVGPDELLEYRKENPSSTDNYHNFRSKLFRRRDLGKSTNVASYEHVHLDEMIKNITEAENLIDVPPMLPLAQVDIGKGYGRYEEKRNNKWHRSMNHNTESIDFYPNNNNLGGECEMTVSPRQFDILKNTFGGEISLEKLRSAGAKLNENEYYGDLDRRGRITFAGGKKSLYVMIRDFRREIGRVSMELVNGVEWYHLISSFANNEDIHDSLLQYDIFKQL